jgi:xylose isomerase
MGIVSRIDGVAAGDTSSERYSSITGPAGVQPSRSIMSSMALQASATVWDSAAANMRTYLLLKERAASFRADPEVQAALEAAKVPELSTPTLGAGETIGDLLADRSAFEDFDASAYFDGKGFGFVKLQQLALEHLLGAR